MSVLQEPGMTPAKLEAFVNDYLRVDLAKYETFIKQLNAEIMEFVQLKNTIESMTENLGGAFKTQVNVGGNCFVQVASPPLDSSAILHLLYFQYPAQIPQARIDNTEHILINVGLEHYVEFTLAEALQFCALKVRALNKQADVVREESVKTRANIKLALLCLHGPQTTAAAPKVDEMPRVRATYW